MYTKHGKAALASNVSLTRTYVGKNYEHNMRDQRIIQALGSQATARSSRFFRIAEGDARFKRLSSASRTVRFTGQASVRQVHTKKRSLVSQALRSSLADSSRLTCDSRLRFWSDFCEVAGLSVEDFFAYDASLITLKVLQGKRTFCVRSWPTSLPSPESARKRIQANISGRCFLQCCLTTKTVFVASRARMLRGRKCGVFDAWRKVCESFYLRRVFLRDQSYNIT